MNNRKNIITALFQQAVSVVSAFILPRLIIGTFGSEVNGLVSSITQFLSFISLLEGGLGAVILAELYKPIEQKDDNRIIEVLSAGSRFFEKLAIIFIAYSAVVSIVFPLLNAGTFSFGYICSMVWILSISTLIHYLFSVTNKLYLQADQKVYIVNLATAGVVAANLIATLILIKIFPEIHAVKLISGLVYLIQPIIYNRFVDRKYHISLLGNKADISVLSNRWDGFAQNLAHFINRNTDIAVLTVCVGYAQVSVYSVYMIVINGLMSMISLISNSYQSAFGKYYASGDYDLLRKKFIRYSDINWCLCLVIYNICLLLINHFIRLYMGGITDADYYQPTFALIIILANLLYCIREPYRFLVLAAGKFKETNKGAIIEAVLNLSVSIILSRRFGLAGVAIGTLVAILYRFIYFAVFLRDNIINLKIKTYIPNIAITLIVVAVNAAVYLLYDFRIDTVTDFILQGMVIGIAELLITGICFAALRYIRRPFESTTH